MAYTKIFPVDNHLSRCLNYTANPLKTKMKNALRDVLDYAQNANKTEQQFFVSGFNCDPTSAFEAMQDTKKFWRKADSDHVHVLAYHVIQSFAPGEITPQQAHEVGCEFARRALADRYELTVSTHLDKAHLHCHIVFNSVSFVDGKMFRNDFKGYFQGIRAVSDQICRERGLSIIDPKQKGKAYTEWQAEKNGKLTVREMVRADVDKALAKAVSWETFVYGLRQMGYTVKAGRNVKYAAIRHKTGSRNIRLKSLGAGYDEASLRELLERRAWGEEVTLPGAAERKPAPSNAQGETPPAIVTPNEKPPVHTMAVETKEAGATGQFSKRPRQTFPLARKYRRAQMRSSIPILPRKKYTGFMALYYRYVYLLGRTRQRRISRRCYFLLREDFRQFDRYVAQFKFAWENRIQSQEELDAVKTAAESERDALAAKRRQLYRKRGVAKKNQDEDKAEALAEEIAELSAQIRVRRKEVMLCGWIAEDAERLRERLAEAERAERQEQQKKQTINKGGHLR